VQLVPQVRQGVLVQLVPQVPQEEQAVPVRQVTRIVPSKRV
jgi:Fe-S cluster biosynthesis and repair protein YggX